MTETETLTLTEEERDLILLFRRHVAEIDALVEQSKVEEEAWRAENPDGFYSPLDTENSSGAKGYSQCVEAMAEVAVAAFELTARTLGVSGFQASMAELDFLRRSRRIDGPFGIYQVHDALYPQYDVVGRIQKVMDSPETIKWLGDEAEKALAEKDDFAAARVIAHWQYLVAKRDALQA